MVELQGEVRQVKEEVGGLRGEVAKLGKRFDNFLVFAGHDVSDLKARMTALEARVNR
jgi:hypothetical protein